jgi:hypothetical protein
VTANHIASWDGSGWLMPDQGVNAPIYEVAISNGALWIGGDFTTTGDGTQRLNKIASYAIAASAPMLAWNTAGDQPLDLLGESVSSAGDINGDGKDDVLVGVPFYDFTTGNLDEGAVYVYYGTDTASGLASTPDVILSTQEEHAQFGWSVAAAGDVDQDGYDDILVGAIGCSHPEVKEGCAYLYRGSAGGLITTPAWSWESDQAYASLGYQVGSAGDVNNDTYRDVFVTAPNFTQTFDQEGAVFVFHSSNTAPHALSAAPSWTAFGGQANANFGLSASSAGLVNNDGYSDLLIGAPNYANGELGEGKAYLYLGAAGGLATTPAWQKEGNQAQAHFGEAVSGLGSVNNDAFGDVAIGAPGYANGQTGEGAVWVYFATGTAAGLNDAAGWVSEGNLAGANYGIAVSGMGDLNGDSFNDLLIGANGYSNGQANEGKVYLFYGDGTGFHNTPDWELESNEAYANFGYAICAAGDMRDNGSKSFLIGAPHHDQNDEGQVFLYMVLP